ncbi:hypothetical protein DY000_02056510 [Brassica cretica]|uniref:AN1-type domain-containing protein n=1 Tax=Brassica cretica TaxID=69181 RepID=A0ABQ7AAS7_BRACR|nr:hypothetical protein DY000_02056510 [Brassica cretica]
MGTPEFPDLGKHCSVDDCKQIDFLPFTCDRCTQVFCLDHRSYNNHNCPKGNRGDVTVVICPLCAKAVRLNPDEDPNITWEKHVNTDCDPSSYEETVEKKMKKCPVPRCRELLTFSNTIRCRDCSVEHCLKHRFGPDHGCAGPKKPESRWSSLLASAEASISRLGTDLSQKLQFANGNSEKMPEKNGKVTVDVCPKCSRGFREPGDLLKHIDKDHHGTSKA